MSIPAKAAARFRKKKEMGGILYDFGREITADTLIHIDGTKRPEKVTLCYGESRAEALDTELCYLKQVLDIPGGSRGSGLNVPDRFPFWEMGYRKVLSYQAACIPLPVHSGKRGGVSYQAGSTV